MKEINNTSKIHGIKLVPVIINDCSSDQTASIINHLPCIAIHLPVNLGIGGAVQTGLRYAIKHAFDAAVQVDGDGQHPADAIPELAKEMQHRNLDVVIGSRYLEKKGFQSSWLRRTGIRYFVWINHLLTGKKILDSTSGFRLMNRKTMELITEIYPDEYPEPEALILYHKLALKVGEYPVTMRERQGGVSSINSFSSVYYMLKVSLAILFTRIRSIH